MNNNDKVMNFDIMNYDFICMSYGDLIITTFIYLALNSIIN